MLGILLLSGMVLLVRLFVCIGPEAASFGLYFPSFSLQQMTSSASSRKLLRIPEKNLLSMNLVSAPI